MKGLGTTSGDEGLKARNLWYFLLAILSGYVQYLGLLVSCSRAFRFKALEDFKIHTM